MLLYFEFEDRRFHAEVTWPKGDDPIVVQLSDKRLTRDLPTDLYFDIKGGNKVSYVIEDPQNKRLSELQSILARRLQEFVNKT